MDYLHFMIAILAVLIFFGIGAYRSALVYIFVAGLILNRVDGPRLTIAALVAVAVLEYIVWLWRQPGAAERQAIEDLLRKESE